MQESGRNESGRNESGRKESGRKESGRNESGRNESGRKESGGVRAELPTVGEPGRQSGSPPAESGRVRAGWGAVAVELSTVGGRLELVNDVDGRRLRLLRWQVGGSLALALALSDPCPNPGPSPSFDSNSAPLSLLGAPSLRLGGSE
jgi:hypothetical protein